ncbi:MAG TPA: tol-pal system protein YbgF [Polyangia bacterium]|nr:tol-pal system protein YbgF [Polyangia bacterium]
MRLAATCCSLLLAAGCAETQSTRDVAELTRRLDEAQRRQAQTEHKMEELEDRVFLLTDQVESQKVAATRRESPRLPVVTLKPSDAPVENGEGDGGIEFQGDARTQSPDRVRPVLRLDESKPAQRASHHATASGSASSVPSQAVPPADLPSENLGVAAAPPIRAVPKEGGERETPPARDPLKLYRAAYDDLRAGRHVEAVRGFREFVRLYPRHDYADNAQYWLGECFYDQKKYLEAASEFRAVVAKYPLGNKAPDALLKLGYCLLAVGEQARGRELLEQVPGTYPRTEAARLASERLAELKEGK